MSVDTRAPSRLEAAAQKLAEATAAFNTRLAVLERAVLATRIEIEAGVPLQPLGTSTQGQAPPGVLHYARHRQTQQWALIVSTGPQQYWPLLEAPRPLRVAAVEAFPTLIRQLEQAAIALAESLKKGEPKIDDAVTLVESMVWPEPEPVVMPTPDPLPRPKVPPGWPPGGGPIFVEEEPSLDDFINSHFGQRRRPR